MVLYRWWKLKGCKVKVKLAWLCLTLCNPMDCIVYGILQASLLEWVAFPFSRESSQTRDWIQVSRIVGRFFTSWATRENESKVTQDCSLPGSSVHGIFQAIVLEWIAISFSRGSSWPRDQTQVSHIVDRCFTIWAIREVQATREAQEYWRA